MNLSHNWFLEDCLDIEYQKYILMNFLQKKEDKIKKSMLFPAVDHINFHYENLKILKKRKEEIEKSLHEDIIGLDLNNKKILKKRSQAPHEIEIYIDNVIKEFLPILWESKNKAEIKYQKIKQQFKIRFPDKNDDDIEYVIVYLDKFYCYKQQFYSLHLIEINENNIFNINNINGEPPCILEVHLNKKLPLKEAVIPIIEREYIIPQQNKPQSHH